MLEEVPHPFPSCLPGKFVTSEGLNWLLVQLPLEWQEGDARCRNSCALPFSSPNLDLLKGSKWGPFSLCQRTVNEDSDPWLLLWGLWVVLCVSVWKHPALPFSWDVLQPDLGSVTCLSLRVKLCGQTGRKEKKNSQPKPKFLTCSVSSAALYSWIPHSTLLHLPWVRLDSCGNFIAGGAAVSAVHVLIAGQGLETMAHKPEAWPLFTTSGFAPMGFVHLQTEGF